MAKERFLDLHRICQRRIFLVLLLVVAALAGVYLRRRLQHPRRRAAFEEVTMTLDQVARARNRASCRNMFPPRFGRSKRIATGAGFMGNVHRLPFGPGVGEIGDEPRAVSARSRARARSDHSAINSSGSSSMASIDAMPAWGKPHNDQ